MNVYFDNAASTKVRDEAISAMMDAMKQDYGNPSSMHHLGRNALKKLEEARENVAYAFKTKADNIYFTSGGTEANNWAIFGTIRSLSKNQKGKHIITSETEHSAVLKPIKSLEESGWEVTYLKPDISGRISADDFSKSLRDDTIFASIMLVNNEVGAINPIGDFAKEIKRRKLPTILHTDAVQAFCKIPFNVKGSGADLIAVSAHKLHGPKGVGALYIKDGIMPAPLIIGGNHEKGKRGGTEPLPAAIGLGIAAKLGFDELKTVAEKCRTLREHAINLIKNNLPDAVFIGNGDSPFLLNFSLPGYKSEVLMNYLDNEGICVSKGSACKKGARSPTLEAMGLKNNIIDGALRVSFSRYSTARDVEYFVDKLKLATETILK